MKKNIFIFGSILALLLSGNMIYMIYLMYTKENLQTNDLLGYAAMVIVFSLTFFGIRNYRNKELDGYISFGKAFKTGALIALLGSTFYVIVWLFVYYLFVPDFIDQYSTCVMNQCMSNGSTPDEIEAKREQITQLATMYENPAFVVLITYSEVLPVGLVVALIGSLILKKKVKS